MAKNTKVTTVQDVENAAKKFANANLTLQSMNAELGKKKLDLETEYREKIDEQQKILEESEALITKYLEDNPHEFGDKKSKKTWGVTIARRIVPTWEFEEGKSWDDFFPQIKKVLSNYIKVEEKLQVAKLKEDYKDVAGKLNKIGVKLVDKDSFSVKA